MTSEITSAVVHRSLQRSAFHLLRKPSRIWPLINAQLRLGRAARVPVTAALLGRADAHGGGEILLGERVLIDGTITPVELVARPGGRIEVGEETFINYGVSISAHALVSIGRRCHIGHYAFIYDNDYHEIENKWALPASAPVVLEDGVWLGTRVIVLKGVRIGHDAVVGAGSVVTRDIPPRTLAVGVPARIIREF